MKLTCKLEWPNVVYGDCFDCWEHELGNWCTCIVSPFLLSTPAAVAQRSDAARGGLPSPAIYSHNAQQLRFFHLLQHGPWNKGLFTYNLLPLILHAVCTCTV